MEVTVQQEASAVDVTPESAVLSAIGEPGQLSAAAVDSNGNAISGASYSWESSDTDIVTVSSTGLISAVGNGTAIVTARLGSASGSANVTVLQEPTTVEVEPASVTLSAIGEESQLTATAADAGGSVISGATFSWESADQEVATVSPSGLVTAVENGTTIVTARVGEVSGEATVVVAAPTETTLYLHTQPDRYLSNEPHSSGETRGSEAPSEWIALMNSDFPAGTYSFSLWLFLETVSTKSFEISLLSRGISHETELATSEVTAFNPLEGSAVRVDGTLDVQVEGAAGDKLIFGIEGIGAGGGGVNVGADAPSHLVTPGRVEVDRVPISEVTVSPGVVNLVPGEEGEMTATFVDIFSDPIDDHRTTTWQSSNSAVASVDPQGRVTGVTVGETTITATMDGISGSSTVRVSDQIEWSVSTGGSGSTASAALTPDGRILVPGTELVALNPDGTTEWSYTTGNTILWAPTVASDGTIYAGEQTSLGRRLVALNPDGTFKWSYSFPGSSRSSSPSLASDGTVYLLSGTSLHAFNPDGTVKWTSLLSAEEPSQGRYPAPAVSQWGNFYLGGIGPDLLALNPNGVIFWAFSLDGNATGSPAIGADETIYSGSDDNHLYAISNAGALRWKFETGGPVHSSPAIAADGTIYFGSSDHYLYGLNLDGTLKWRFQTGDEVLSTPAVGSDGTIYVGSNDDRLYAINPDGTEKWHVITGGDVRASPTLAPDGTLYVASEDGKLYAIRTPSSGLANSPWPKLRHDGENTGNGSGG